MSPHSQSYQPEIICWKQILPCTFLCFYPLHAFPRRWISNPQMIYLLVLGQLPKHCSLQWIRINPPFHQPIQVSLLLPQNGMARSL